jgi:murein DD-endopeptidase MepM/ murein hydrolase activator NlpD
MIDPTLFSRRSALIAMQPLIASCATESNAMPQLSLDLVDDPCTVKYSGREWLVCELDIASNLSEPSELNALRFGGHHGLLRVEQLLAVLTDATSRPVKSRVLPPEQPVVAWLWHEWNSAEGSNTLWVEGLAGNRAVRSPQLSFTHRLQTPTALHPPLSGGPWVAVFDPHFAHGHRRSVFRRGDQRFIPARFAIDFIRLDLQGGHSAGATNEFERWYGVNADVLAVSDAVVDSVRDGRPDVFAPSAPPAGWTNADVAGNYVCLRLPDGRFAFYEHLLEGSIRVQAGQTVRRGQVIAHLGRSGVNSSGPHLHFHVADAADAIFAQGRPFSLSSIDVLGHYANMDDAESGQPWRGAHIGQVKNELPPPNAVVMFK